MIIVFKYGTKIILFQQKTAYKANFSKTRKIRNFQENQYQTLLTVWNLTTLDTVLSSKSP